MGPGESPAYDALYDQVIGGTGCADPDSEIELPLGGEVDVDGREELLLLFSQGVEPAQRPERRVVLEPARNFPGYVVAHLEIGRKLHSPVHAGSVKRAVQG